MTEEIINNKTKKKKHKIGKYIPIHSRVIFALFLFAIVIKIIASISTPFANFFNENISGVTRMLFSKATSWIPFSITETFVLSVPVVFIVVICTFYGINDRTKSIRFMVTTISVATLLFSIFIINLGLGYNNSSLGDKLGLEQKNVTAQELYDTATKINDELVNIVEDVDFPLQGSTTMPYSLDTMVYKLNDAYAKAAEKYTFIYNFHSNVKYIALSKPLTYTHFSGVYCYYTGEANININFPDYSIPFTTAHEMSHQRGIAREDECNFMAYLVCMESDDAYIKYSAYASMLEYVMNSLYAADKEMYSALWNKVPVGFQNEMISYSEFFKEYEKSTASKVSSAINNTYLKSQGVSEGEKSYGLVVDLACAYYRDK